MPSNNRDLSLGNNPVIVVLIGLVLLMVVVYLSILAANGLKQGRYIGRPETQRDTITIQGQGKVTAVPDIGQIMVTMVTSDKDVVAAQSKNTTQFNQLIDALKQSGIDKKDLTSSNYSVYAQNDYVEGRQVFRAYEVTQSLSIKIRDLQKAGNIIALASQNGVNQVSGLTFTIDEPEALRQQAREKALDNAIAKAKSLADRAGVHLGKIVSFSESSYAGYPQPIYYAEKAMNRADAVAPAPQFEQGSQDVSVEATVQFELY